MNIRETVFFLVACFYLLAGNVYAAENYSQLEFISQDNRITLEVVSTQEDRARGLMFRNELAADTGMLFVYPDEKMRGVWMKSTLIPLDILFIASDGKIISILPHLTPCAADPCPVYTSDLPARYMLEVNAGYIDRWQIKPGDKVILIK